MTEQSQKQKDVNSSSKNEQAYLASQKGADPTFFPFASSLYANAAQGSSQKDADTLASKTSDTGDREPRDNLTIGPGVYQPTVTQMPNDNPDSKMSEAGQENGFVDAPAGRNPTELQTDAKRDASPNQKPTMLNADQSRDK
jgi:hypothetical protein